MELELPRFNSSRIALKNALRYKPKAQFYLDLADHIREQRWKKKDTIGSLCLHEVYNRTFDENLQEMFSWDIEQDRDAYDIVTTIIFHRLPSCHNCEHTSDEHRTKMREYYKELFSEHYSISKTTKEKRAEFERIKGLPRFERFLLDKMNEQGLQCYYCDKYLVRGYEVDHMVPLSRGGSNHPENLVLACRRCNTSKNDLVENHFSLDPEYVDWVTLEYKEGAWIPVITN